MGKTAILPPESTMSPETELIHVNLDCAEPNPGEHRFIFNPADPSHKAPKRGK